MGNHTDAGQLRTLGEELFSCVIGNCLDAMGRTHQFLPRQDRLDDFELPDEVTQFDVEGNPTAIFNTLLTGPQLCTLN